MTAPVCVPLSTRRDPSVVLITLAETPGLFAAEFMAEAMPASVLLLVSILIAVEAPPTAMVSVPVPSAAELETGAEVALAVVDRGGS